MEQYIILGVKTNKRGDREFLNELFIYSPIDRHLQLRFPVKTNSSNVYQTGNKRRRLNTVIPPNKFTFNFLKRVVNLITSRYEKIYCTAHDVDYLKTLLSVENANKIVGISDSSLDDQLNSADKGEQLYSVLKKRYPANFDPPNDIIARSMMDLNLDEFDIEVNNILTHN
jgi:hypothetical protein